MVGWWNLLILLLPVCGSSERMQWDRADRDAKLKGGPGNARGTMLTSDHTDRWGIRPDRVIEARRATCSGDCARLRSLIVRSSRITR